MIPPLLQAVKDLGYEQPSPIQEQAIPLVLAGRDLMAGAQTGTGKTAAFALPTLQRLAPHASTSMSPARHPIRVLVLTPTRELAIQVEESFREYGKHLPIRTCLVYGGADMNAQILQLRKGIEILVATPGRLLDHVQNKTLMLNQVSVLILDEADRMLDMGFMPDIKRIVALLPPQRQNLLFSATFPDEIKNLTRTLLNDPAEIQIARRNAVADSVTHVVHPVPREKKREALAYIIQTRGLKQVLVFAGTRIGANRLAHQLRKDHIQTDAIHGDKTQGEREAALEAFKAGKTTVLVATDVASRGLDIEALPQVINFDIPHSPEDYVHRIGRTGRAGMSGEAISLVSPEDSEYLAQIEKLIKKQIERVLIPGFAPNTGTVATMMGGERRHGPRPSDRPRPDRGERPERGERGERPARLERSEHFDRPERSARPDRPRERDRDRERSGRPQREPRPIPASQQSSYRPTAKSSDPIFSAPYEPGTSTAEAPKAQEPASSHGKRRERPVAALLGGLKR